MVFSVTSSIQDGHFSFLTSAPPCWCYLLECGLFSGLRAWPRPDDRFIHSTRSQRRRALGTMCVPFLPEISFTRGSWLVVLVESELAYFFASWIAQEQVEILWLGWKCPETTTKTMTKGKDKTDTKTNTPSGGSGGIVEVRRSGSRYARELKRVRWSLNWVLNTDGGASITWRSLIKIEICQTYQ